MSKPNRKSLPGMVRVLVGGALACGAIALLLRRRGTSVATLSDSERAARVQELLRLAAELERAREISPESEPDLRAESAEQADEIGYIVDEVTERDLAQWAQEIERGLEIERKARRPEVAPEGEPPQPEQAPSELPASADGLLTSAQVAALLGISAKDVATLAKHRNIGQRESYGWRFTTADVEALRGRLRRHSTEPRPTPPATEPRAGMTTAQAAAALGIGRHRVADLARELGVGRDNGHGYWFSAVEVEVMRNRPTRHGRGPVPQAGQPEPEIPASDDLPQVVPMPQQASEPTPQQAAEPERLAEIPAAVISAETESGPATVAAVDPTRYGPMEVAYQLGIHSDQVLALAAELGLGQLQGRLVRFTVEEVATLSQHIVDHRPAAPTFDGCQSPREVAEILGRSIAQVDELARACGVGHQAAGIWRFWPSDVRAMRDYLAQPPRVDVPA